MFNEEESFEIWKILGLFKNTHNHFKNMVEGHISQESRLKNIDETKNYFKK